MSYLETYSTIYIEENVKPVVFDNNIFRSNMGVSGGAISINNPDMRKPKDAVPQAFTILKDNTFENNQAYL